MTIVPPIIVIDRDGWLTLHPSIELAEEWLEAPDVEDNEYVVLGGAGEKLEIRVKEPPASIPWYRRLRYQPEVQIKETHADPAPDDVRAILVEALSASHSETSPPDDATLNQLRHLAQDLAAKKEHLRAPNWRRQSLTLTE